jgi:GNAT superfamily N-acetyltransferase
MSDVPRLDDVVTYLEIRERPTRASLPTPLGKLALMRAEPCTVSFYRYLYAAVGEKWAWFERRLWSDERLRSVLDRPTTEISVLHVGGVPAGYWELDRSEPENVELAYFGLVADFVGRGLGPWFLQSAIESSWTGPTQRLWVHTCTFDHPKALGLYQRLGFTVYQRRKVSFPDPRLLGALPRDLTHPLLPPL